MNVPIAPSTTTHDAADCCTVCQFGEVRRSARGLLCEECDRSERMDDDANAFLILAPDLTRSFVSHWARALALTAFAATQDIDHRRALDLMREGLSPLTGNPGLGFFDPIAAERLRRSVILSYQDALSRRTAARKLVGTSRPTRLSPAISALPATDQRRLRASLHVFPRQIETNRIASWIEKGYFA